jgi:hypothetical protein
VEDGPAMRLVPAVCDALQLTDDLCWASLSAGDVPTFAAAAAVSGELFDLGVSALLFDEHHLA